MSIRYYRNDETGKVFAASRCKTMNNAMMKPKLRAATTYNKLIAQPHIELTRTGRIKNEADFIHINNKANARY